MGTLFGGYLSKTNQVWLIDVSSRRVEQIMEHGACIREADGSEEVFHPAAVTGCAGLPQMDLVVVFVKAMYTLSALESNKAIIGPDTYLMTLQNGAGHEAKLLQFADAAHVIIGSTQHNSSVMEDGFVHHGGGGHTYIGLLSGNSGSLKEMADNFTACGFDCTAHNEIQKQIWNKLFLNTAASSLTAVLQVPLGFIVDDSHARELMRRMACEAVTVANALNVSKFDEQQVIASIENVLLHGKGGYTSIYADIKNGKRTEVDTISGSVVEVAHTLGIPVPCHEMVVNLIHALENRNQNNIH